MIDLDLDALVPQEKKIKLNGKEYSVKQPTLGQLLMVISMSEKLQANKESAEALGKMMEIIVILIPEMKDESLTAEQAFKLLEFVIKMATPSDVKELEKNGVEVEKKTLNSVEK